MNRATRTIGLVLIGLEIAIMAVLISYLLSAKDDKMEPRYYQCLNVRFSIPIDRAIREEQFLVPFVDGELIDADNLMDIPRFKLKVEQFKLYLERAYRVNLEIVEIAYVGSYLVIED